MNERSPAPQRPDTDENPPASREELETLSERDKTFPEDRKAARPADEVVEPLLRRYPHP
jgi:hypothetical protein